MVSFTPGPLYPIGKSPQYPFDRRLGGPPETIWTLWRKENKRKGTDVTQLFLTGNSSIYCSRK
jgi:hypothetical protein